MKLSYILTVVAVLVVLVASIGMGMSSLTDTLEARNNNVPDSIKHLMNKN